MTCAANVWRRYNVQLFPPFLILQLLQSFDELESTHFSARREMWVVYSVVRTFKEPSIFLVINVSDMPCEIDNLAQFIIIGSTRFF